MKRATWGLGWLLGAGLLASCAPGQPPAAAPPAGRLRDGRGRGAPGVPGRRRDLDRRARGVPRFLWATTRQPAPPGATPRSRRAPTSPATRQPTRRRADPADADSSRCTTAAGRHHRRAAPARARRRGLPRRGQGAHAAEPRAGRLSRQPPSTRRGPRHASRARRARRSRAALGAALRRAVPPAGGGRDAGPGPGDYLRFDLAPALRSDGRDAALRRAGARQAGPLQRARAAAARVLRRVLRRPVHGRVPPTPTATWSRPTTAACSSAAT